MCPTCRTIITIFALVIQLVSAVELLGSFWSEDWNEHLMKQKRETGVLKASTMSEAPTADGSLAGSNLGEGMDARNNSMESDLVYGAYSNPHAFKEWQYSVVRIECIKKSTNIMEPYRDSDEEQNVGSGFMVKAPDPTVCNNETDLCIVTNAHVVRSCKRTIVQLPRLSTTMYEAYVPMISFDFDLAVVKLKEPAKLIAAFQQADKDVKLFELQIGGVETGHSVVALGFSLGSGYLKYSEGIISGGESINGWMVHQSTAPISNSNSGGPLLLPNSTSGSTSVKIVGVNFASDGSLIAQNLNYVVPALRVAQILYQYHKYRCTFEASNDLCSPESGFKVQWTDHKMATMDSIGSLFPHPSGNDVEKPKHVTFRVPPLGVVTAQSTKAQLQAQGCNTGIVIDRIQKYSLFNTAKPVNDGGPPLKEGDYLVRVRNSDVDEFGMGRDLTHMQLYVSYKDLLTFQTKLDDDVQITMCRDGTYTNYTVTLTWNETLYQPGIRYIEEPEYDDAARDFEMFAGVTLMNLNLNHLYTAIRLGASSLSRYLPEQMRAQRKVVITHCAPGETCSGIMLPGMILDSINGVEIQTLEDLRGKFKPELCPDRQAAAVGDCKDQLWEVVTDRGVLMQVNFTEELSKALAAAVDETYRLTPAVTQYMYLVPGHTSSTISTSTTSAAPTETSTPTTTVQQSNSAVEKYEWTFLAGKTATQSTTSYGNQDNWRIHAAMNRPPYDASLAIDENTDGVLDPGHSCTMTLPTQDPWWQVDTGDVLNISQIRLHNRVDGLGGRLDKFTVSVGMSAATLHSCGSAAEDVPVRESDETILVNCSAETRFVRISLPGPNKILSICEIELNEKKLGMPGNLHRLGEDDPESSLISKAQSSVARNAVEYVEMKKTDVQKLYQEFQGVADALGIAKGHNSKNADSSGSLSSELATLAGALGLHSQNHKESTSPPKPASLIQEDEGHEDDKAVSMPLRSETGTSALEISSKGRVLPGTSTRQTMRRH